MAISAAAVYEMRTLGNVANGGGFVAGTGVDYTLSNTPFATYTDLVIGAANDLSSVTRPFIADDVGNIINQTSGTGFTVGRYQILSVAGGVATLDRSPGTPASTGGNARLGGAMTMTDANFEIAVPGNKFWVKNDGNHVPGALAVATAGTSTAAITVEGYTTTRGDGFSGNTIVWANHALIPNGGNTVTFGSFWIIKCLNYTGSAIGGMRSGTSGQVIACKGTNTSTGVGLGVGQNGRIIACEAQSSTGSAAGISAGATGLNVFGCYLHDAPSLITFSSNGNVAIGNILVNGTTAALNVGGTDNNQILYNTVYNCGDGISAAGSENNNVIGNTFDTCTIGLDWSTGHFDSNFFAANNFNNNTTDYTNAADAGIGDTFVNPNFVNPASGDFQPDPAFAGLMFPALFPGDLTANYLAPGAAQPAPGGGGGGAINPLNGLIVS